MERLETSTLVIFSQTAKASLIFGSQYLPSPMLLCYKIGKRDISGTLPLPRVLYIATITWTYIGSRDFSKLLLYIKKRAIY